MSRRLRVLHVVVQPVLVWDDGETLTAGPPLEPQTLPVSALAGLAEGMPEQVAALEAQVAESEQAADRG